MGGTEDTHAPTVDLAHGGGKRMRLLEVRRHGHRKTGGGSQLSQEGVSRARELGSQLGPFGVVAASVVPRARETAIAMGFAVDQEIVPLLTDEEAIAEMEVSKWWTDPQPLAALARLIGSHGAAWRFGSAIVALWRDLVISLPDDGAALVITHSGDLELALVACYPTADHASWGKMFAPFEGARLVFDGDPPRFTRIELLRENATPN